MTSKMNKFNPASVRKLKYGTMAIVLTAVTIAAVVIFNVIFSSLAYKYNWYADLTKEKLYGLSDAGRAMLDEIDDEISIIFCCPFDELEKNSAQKMVYELVKEMAAEYKNINYSYVDIIENPTAVTKYKTTSVSSIKTTNVIVESGTEFRVFELRAFFVFNDQNSSTPWAFNGEKKLISAMIQITQAETPIAYFTSTHGEQISASMAELFYDAGYELRAIDLTQEDFAPEGRLVVIANPAKDFIGITKDTAGKKSEIEKIDDFLDGFGNLIVFLDPDNTTDKYPELCEFLSEWGIAFDNSVLKDPSASLDTTHYSLVGQYSVEETIGASLISTITSLAAPPKTIVSYARPMTILWDAKDSRVTSTVLYTSDNAERYIDGKVVDKGQYPLITLSRESRYIENTPHYSYVFAAGSNYLFADDYLGSKAYGNSDIVYAMMRAMGKEQVPVDLDFKVFDDESLDITTAEASGWTIFLCSFLPAVSLITGLVVWLRRKHA